MLRRACVRWCCAAALVGELQVVMRVSNRRLGRAAASPIDLTTYAPAQVVLQPGPLFDDVDGIASRVREHFEQHAAPRACLPATAPPRGSSRRAEALLRHAPPGLARWIGRAATRPPSMRKFVP